MIEAKFLRERVCMVRGKQQIDPWTLELLEQASHFFTQRQVQAYLVGGSVRNLLLDEDCIDWDIAIEGEAPRLARRLAERLGGYYVRLHEKASRVVVKHEELETVFDIVPLQGETIEQDLRLRDFTINAIAIPFADLIQSLTTTIPFSLIDPLHGADDLAARQLRVVDTTVFQHDPLRMLRAVRFMMRYQLSLDPLTEQLLKRDASLLTQAASERIHEELYTILKPDGATGRLRFLDAHGLLTTLLPEFILARGMLQPELHNWDVFDHSLETVAALERLAAVLQQPIETIRNSPLDSHGEGDLAEIRTLLDEAEEQKFFQFATLTSVPMKLAALLHDIGKPVTYTEDEEGNIHFYHHPQAGIPIAQEIMQRLSASTHDRRLVQQVVAHHMRPGQLSHDTVTPRAIRRFFVDLGPAGIYVALISLADHLSMRGPLPLTSAWEKHLATVRLLLSRYIRERTSILPPRLITPEELMRRLNISPGPIVGQLLEHLAEAQADGTIHSKEEALWLAEEKLQEKKTTG